MEWGLLFFLLSEALLIEAQKRGHKYKSSTSCSLGRQRMTWSNGKTCWPNRHTDKKFDKGKSTTFFYTIWVDDNKNYDIKKLSWCHTTKKSNLKNMYNLKVNFLDVYHTFFVNLQFLLFPAVPFDSPDHQVFLCLKKSKLDLRWTWTYKSCF